MESCVVDLVTRDASMLSRHGIRINMPDMEPEVDSTSGMSIRDCKA